MDAFHPAGVANSLNAPSGYLVMPMKEDVLTILPLPAFRDNYIWCIVQRGHACVVDPGDAAPVLQAMERLGAALEEVWITHLHPDHTGGLSALKKAYPDLVVRGPSHPGVTLLQKENDQFAFAGGDQIVVRVQEIPGHTPDHLAYVLVDDTGHQHVFCGDTLFSAGCGRLFGGTIHQLHASLQRFTQLPDATLFYPAHEYTLANLRFAAHVEPSNADVISRMNAIETCPDDNLPSLPTTLAREKTINPFIRAIMGTFKTDVLIKNGERYSNTTELIGILRKMKDIF